MLPLQAVWRRHDAEDTAAGAPHAHPERGSLGLPPDAGLVSASPRLLKAAGARQATLAVRKQSYLGFNSSLELSWRSASGKSKTVFLTSFLSRNEALRLISHNWQQCRCVPVPLRCAPGARPGGKCAEHAHRLLLHVVILPRARAVEATLRPFPQPWAPRTAGVSGLARKCKAHSRAPQTAWHRSRPGPPHGQRLTARMPARRACGASPPPRPQADAGFDRVASMPAPWAASPAASSASASAARPPLRRAPSAPGELTPLARGLSALLRPPGSTDPADRSVSPADPAARAPAGGAALDARRSSLGASDCSSCGTGLAGGALAAAGARVPRSRQPVRIQCCCDCWSAALYLS